MKYINKKLTIDSVNVQEIAKRFKTPTYCYSYSRLKERLIRLVLEIIEEYSQVHTEAAFLQVCLKIDKTAKYTDSKKRKHTYSSVKAHLNSPVETEKRNLPIAEKTYQL